MNSTQRRSRITVAIGAISAVVFSGLYGLIAANSPSTEITSPNVLTTSSDTTGLTTNVSMPTPAPKVAAVTTGEDDEDEDEEETVAANPAPTVAPRAEATTAATTTTTTVQTRTRGS